MGMASDISRWRPLFDQDRASFRDLLTSDAAARNLPGAMLIDKDRNILESAQTGIIQQKFATPPSQFLSNVGEEEPTIAVITEGNYVAAVMRLRAF
jgi:two-component system nitrogen regulation sensor histidine kinase NtrY